MKNIINKIVFGSLTLALSSCIGNYENINSNPYEAPDLSADGYALGSAMNNLAGCVVSPDVNTAQFTDCLLGGPLGGYFADSNAGFTESISNFNPKDDWSRVFLKSDKVLLLQLFQHCQRLALKPCAKPLGHFLECADPFARIDGIANTINAAV